LCLWLVPAAFAAIYVLLPPASPLLTADSPGYMYFDPTRPIGYPAVLYLVRHLTGRYDAIRDVQIAVFCLSAAAAGLAVFRYAGSLLAACVFESGALGYPGPMRLADQIISDSLSASAMLLFIAAVLHFAARPSLRRYVAVGLAVAAAITLRPVNVALVPPALVLPLICGWRLDASLWRAWLTAAVLVALGVAATPLANLAIHGNSEASSPLARGVFQKAIFAEGSGGCDADYIDGITGPVIRYLRGAPEEFRDFLRHHYSGYLRFQSIMPGLVQRHHLASLRQTDSILMCYSLARLRQDPGSFLRQTVHEYWNLVSNYTFITAARRASYLEFVKDHPPVVPASVTKPEEEYRMRRDAIADTIGSGLKGTVAFEEQETTFAPPQARSWLLIMLVDVLQVAAVGWATILCGVLVLRLAGRSVADEWAVLGVLSLALQLSLVITAIVEIALPRYVFPLWPLMWLIATLGGLHIKRKTATVAYAPDRL
jgi:hypothetical protein